MSDWITLWAIGSSPRAWGKHFLPSPSGAGLRDSGGEASRLIPTGVGKRDLPEKFLYVDWFIPTGVRKTLPRVRAEPDSVTVEALPPGQETIVPAEKSPVRTRPSAPGSSNLQTTIARLLSAQSENAAASMIL